MIIFFVDNGRLTELKKSRSHGTHIISYHNILLAKAPLIHITGAPRVVQMDLHLLHYNFLVMRLLSKI